MRTTCAAVTTGTLWWRNCAVSAISVTPPGAIPSTALRQSRGVNPARAATDPHVSTNRHTVPNSDIANSRPAPLNRLA